MSPSLQADIKFGTPLHTRIKDLVLNRFDASKRQMSLRYTRWRESEDLYLAYTKPSTADLKQQAARDRGKKTFVTISVPYSYATLLTAHTYWASVFLSRNPVLQYTARHGEAHQKVQAVEALMDYQIQVGQMLVPLYLWLLDAGKYGIGVIGNYWADEYTNTSAYVEVPATILGVPIPGKTKKELQTIRVPGYQGNKIYNVRPYDFFPDHRVAITNFQSGEYCGRYVRLGWNEIARGVAGGRYIADNVDHLRKRITSGESDRETGSSNIDLPSSEEFPLNEQWSKGRVGAPVEAIEMVVELVPRDIGLGEQSYPEKWVFTLASREVVIGAQPLGCDHGRFPYFLQTYEMEAYGHASRGMLEIIKPLNETLDWLFNTHFYNVRKVLQDAIVVDPSKIVFKDLFDEGPGRVVRLSPQAYGTDVRTVLTQMNLMDITGNNLKDAQLVMEMIQRVTGVTDNIMGMVYAGGRKTATEVRTSSSFGVNRLRTFSEYNSALGWAPLSQVLLQNTQQLYDIVQRYKVAGDLLQADPKFLTIDRDMILGFYDFVPVDGTMPIDRFAQANLWKEILIGMAQMPQIAMQYDLGGIFSWMAQLAGLKNITQFKIQVLPDDMMRAQAAQGAQVPVNGTGTGTGLGIQPGVGEPVPM